MRLSELSQQYLQHLCAARRSPRTIAWYEQQLGVWLDWRALHEYPDAIPTDVELDAYLAAQHAAGLAPRTVHARYRAIRALLLWAERRRRLAYTDNPVHLVDAPSVPHDRQPHATMDQLHRLQAAIGNDDWVALRDQLMLLLLYYCGLRVGELSALMVEDLDLQRGEVVIRSGKGGKTRVVPAPAELRPAALAYLYARPSHSLRLIVRVDYWHGESDRLRPEGIRQMLIRRCKRAGMAPINPHAFRHSFAMWLLNAGCRLEVVSAAMGHSTTAVTQSAYAHTLPITVRREYDTALRKHLGIE
jgi:integrase/recombinase XerC